MPLFDVKCRSCAWARDDVYEPVGRSSSCPECGGETAHVWKQNSRANVIPDEYTTPWVAEHLGHEPVLIRSRSQLKRELQARGLEPMVRHVGEQGSDKSKRTTRWI
jgi:hypothetical protein